MNKEPSEIPSPKHWSQLAQGMKSSAMSRGGKLRRTTSFLRWAGVAVVVGGVMWGGWEVMQALQENPLKSPAGAKTVAVKNIELKTDGVLDNAWLVRTLALPKDVSLVELDLQRLRLKLLASGQVNAAALTKFYPDTLKVALSERSPVVRVKAEWRGEQVTLLVARDGVVFEGTGYEPALIDSLPWLDGVKLSRVDDQWNALGNIAVVAELLSCAQRNTDHLYKMWQVVSVARLEQYGQIEIRTKQGTTVVFGANADSFFQQIAKLDYQWEMFASLPTPPVRVDLSLGRDVSVAFQPVVLPSVAPVSPRPASSGARMFNLLPQSADKTKL